MWPEYGLPVAVLYENEVSMSKYRQQSPPPMGNRNRPIVPSTVPAGPIARRGGAAYSHLAPRLRPYIRCVR